MISALLRKTLTNYLFFPIAKHINIAPNLITLLSLPFAFLALVFLSLKNWYIALLFIFISSIIDNIDGAVAKLHNKKTRFGSYLDGFCDKIQEFFIYLGLALAGYVFESFVAFSLSFFVNFAKIRAEMVKSLDNMDWPSIGERAERIIIIFLSIALNALINANDIDFIRVGLYTVSLISFFGIVQRFIFANKYLSEK